MAEIFPGAPTAIVALAAAMEVSKLVIAGFLAANWSETRGSLRGVLVVLVAGLAVLNGAGVYGRLTEVHLGVTVAATSSVAERITIASPMMLVGIVDNHDQRSAIKAATVLAAASTAAI